MFPGYTLRPVQEAKNYDVISFARAMNDDFGPRVQKLFEPEREAALDAQNTGTRRDCPPSLCFLCVFIFC